MASYNAIRLALVRLCKDGDIIRVAQGIYCYPKIDTIWVRKNCNKYELSRYRKTCFLKGKQQFGV